MGLLGIDSQAHLGLGELIVPFASHYRPFWTGLGIVGAELLVALVITNYYRTRLAYKTWRRLHYLNLGVWVAATAHGLGAGTDSGSAWFIALYAVTTTTIVCLGIRRFSAGNPRATPAEKNVSLEPGRS